MSDVTSPANKNYPVDNYGMQQSKGMETVNKVLGKNNESDKTPDKGDIK